MILEVVVLAAGQGKRMRSRHSKLLHPLAAKPVLAHVIETALALNPHGVHLVHGHQGTQIQQAMHAYPVNWVHQPQQRGTGDAVWQAVAGLPSDHWVLVLYGDVPLLSKTTLTNLLKHAQHHTQSLVLLTAQIDDPTGFGRIVFDDHQAVVAIVEERDATVAQRQLKEINTGVMLAPAGQLQRWLPQLRSDNAQSELYLTDVVAMAVAQSLPVNHQCVLDPVEIMGVNDRAQLAVVERHYQQRQAQQLMAAGVTLRDPSRVDVRGSLHCDSDVTIDVNVVFEGEVTVASNVTIGSHCVIRNSQLGEGVVVHPHSIVDGAQVGAGAQIGPFARIRPGTVMSERSKLGTFVEAKKTRIGAGSKANHLAYLGDTLIGPAVNIGAGVIVCNYDGHKKHQTVIGDGAFIGSGTQLVAPVVVGKQAVIGAGTTLRQNAPDDALTLTPKSQKTVAGWRPPWYHDT